MGQVLTCVIIVSIPAVIVAGPFFNSFLHKVYPSMCHKDIDVAVLGDFREFEEKDTPASSQFICGPERFQDLLNCVRIGVDGAECVSVSPLSSLCSNIEY